MEFNEEAFLKRYKNLNAEQRLAVDTIYGPVMVIAGPGTGKTEVLSMRIANLLRSEAQVQPQEILCLTYTDEATSSMRRRLLQIAGNAAHKVNIHTFHGFCNNVIQNNSELFSMRSLQPITDLERTELLYELLDELPQGHPLRKLSGSIYFDSGRLSRLFDMMKRENLAPQDIATAVDSYVASLPDREEYVYKRSGKGYKAGELKQSQIDEETRKVETTKAAGLLYDAYISKMKDKGRYDFNDMLVWVLQVFKENPALLQSYQERYQYVLVDEFQDTNGAQSELLRLMADFWEDPNLFVVGDDDQSIYEFQGARIRNIIEFYERHKETIKVIVLPQNYRSSQAILNKATATIENNRERLIYQLKELSLDKNIVAAHPRFSNNQDTVTPTICVYQNILQEEAAVVMQIEKLQQSGFPLSSVAILYAQHKQAENIMALMERKGIPYSVKRPVNVLQEPLVQQVVLVLRYLNMERQQAFSAEAMLYEIMHAPYYGVRPSDIALLSLQMQQNRVREGSWGKWRLLLNNYLLLESAGPQSAKALYRLGTCLDNWLQQQSSLQLPLLVEKIMYESGIVAYALQTTDNTWNAQVLYTFFNFIKDTADRNPQMKLPGLLSIIDKMNDEGISLPLQKVIQHEEGVHCYTAHGSKGNEFEHVFLIGCTRNFWEARRSGGNEYKLPDTITGTNEDKDKTYKVEVARRLFYVALTRAKKHLHISCAQKDNNGKDLEPTVFLDEISTLDERCEESITTPEALAYMEWAMKPVPEVRVKLANHQYIDRALQQINMSYTNLSKYLKCPLTFYYECILKVPFLKGDALSFGVAIHNTLERTFREMKQAGGTFPGIEEVQKYFDSYMFRERESFTATQYERRIEQGHGLLTDYYTSNIDKWDTNVEIEYKVPRYFLDGIPITGKIDKIVIDKEGCTVIDYKTGDPDKSMRPLTASPNDSSPNGGDYWRQMVFYKLLLENQPERDWKVKRGIFDFVEKGRTSGDYKPVEIPLFPNDEQIVREQLKDTWSRIMNHEFDKGCGKEDCYWCNFTRKYELVRPGGEEFVEIDDL